MVMNKDEMLAYLKDLQNQVAYVSFFSNNKGYEVGNRYNELLKAKGYSHNIPNDAEEKLVADYLECYINSIYDCQLADRIKF